jgi:hypothetical protein
MECEQEPKSAKEAGNQMQAQVGSCQTSLVRHTPVWAVFLTIETLHSLQEQFDRSERSFDWGSKSGNSGGLAEMEFTRGSFGRPATGICRRLTTLRR